MEGRQNDASNGTANSDELSSYRLVQMLINEIMNDPNPTELINSNIARLSAEVSSLSNNQGHRQQSTSSGVVDQGSNTDILPPPIPVRIGSRHFIPSNEEGGTSSSSDDTEQWRSVPPGPRTSSPPPATTIPPLTGIGRTSLWRQIRLLPPSALEMIPALPPSDVGYQSWRQLRQLGHNVRRFNLESRLSQRFPSTLINVAGAQASRSPLLQTIFPEQPERIAIGGRSFQPTAKFDQAPKAKPAKPCTPGFARCHEKALAAQFITNLIGMRSDFVETEEELLPGLGGLDIFNRFWTETDTVDDEGGDLRAQTEGQVQSQWLGVVGHALFNTEGTASLHYTESDTAADYLRWDAETTVTNHTRQLWDALSQTRSNMSSASLSDPAIRRSEATATTYASTGVGTQANWSDSSSEDEMPALIESNNSRPFPAPAPRAFSASTSNLPSRPRASNRFMGETLSNDAVAAMFALDMPAMPSRASLLRGQYPSAFMSVQSDPIRGYTADYAEVDESDEESDGEGSSVFPLIPQADSTPSPLFSGLEDDQAWSTRGSVSAPSCQIYSDDPFTRRFGSDACYGSVQGRRLSNNREEQDQQSDQQNAKNNARHSP